MQHTVESHDRVLAKFLVPLVGDEEISVEPVGGGAARVVGSPFMVPDVAYGDVVLLGDDRVARRVLSRSQHSAVSILAENSEARLAVDGWLAGREWLVERRANGEAAVYAIAPTREEYPAVVDGFRFLGEFYLVQFSILADRTA